MLWEGNDITWYYQRWDYRKLARVKMRIAATSYRQSPAWYAKMQSMDNYDFRTGKIYALKSFISVRTPKVFTDYRTSYESKVTSLGEGLNCKLTCFKGMYIPLWWVQSKYWLRKSNIPKNIFVLPLTPLIIKPERILSTGYAFSPWVLIFTICSVFHQLHFTRFAQWDWTG